jgi:hypothetical protein
MLGFDFHYASPLAASRCLDKQKADLTGLFFSLLIAAISKPGMHVVLTPHRYAIRKSFECVCGLDGTYATKIEMEAIARRTYLYSTKDLLTNLEATAHFVKLF